MLVQNGALQLHVLERIQDPPRFPVNSIECAGNRSLPPIGSTAPPRYRPPTERHSRLSSNQSFAKNICMCRSIPCGCRETALRHRQEVSLPSPPRTKRKESAESPTLENTGRKAASAFRHHPRASMLQLLEENCIAGSGTRSSLTLEVASPRRQTPHMAGEMPASRTHPEVPARRLLLPFAQILAGHYSTLVQVSQPILTLLRLLGIVPSAPPDQCQRDSCAIKICRTIQAGQVDSVRSGSIHLPGPPAVCPRASVGIHKTLSAIR